MIHYICVDGNSFHRNISKEASAFKREEELVFYKISIFIS